jgi:hypothetical protein
MRLAVIATLVLGVAVGPAVRANDTYLLPESWTESWTTAAGAPGRLHLTDSHGFPALDFGPEASQVAWSELRVGATRTALRPEAAPGAALPLAFAASEAGLAVAALTLAPADIDLEPSAVEHYFEEVGASEEVRAAYAALGPGAALHETYVKHVKALICVGACADRSAALEPSGQNLEFVELPSFYRDGAPVGRRFRLVSRGEPVPGQRVELTDCSGAQRALVTDAHGVVAIGTPPKGATLLSASLLRPPAHGEERFMSDFATLSFEIR